VAADTPLSIHIHSERAMFQVLVSPGTVGTIEAETPVPEDHSGRRFRRAGEITA
jgi:hypothetical protein